MKDAMVLCSVSIKTERKKVQTGHERKEKFAEIYIKLGFTKQKYEQTTD